MQRTKYCHQKIKQTVGPTKLNEKPFWLNLLSITNHQLLLNQTKVCPPRHPSHNITQITTNLIKINWSFLKVLKDTEINIHMHNDTYTVNLTHTTIVKKQNFVPPSYIELCPDR